MYWSRAASLRSQRDQGALSGFRGSFGSVITRSSATKRFSSAACSRPARLSKRGKCRTMNR